MQLSYDKDIDLKSLIEGCKNSGRNSQRKLYEHFYGYALNICLRYSADREDATEILNEGFLKAFINIEKYNSEYPFKVWLRRILINTAIDNYRSNQNRPVFLELLDNNSAEAITEPEFELLPGDDILPVVQQLSPAYRIVFNLYVMEEYSHKEIADLLGISESTSRTNLLKAKVRLKEMILADGIKRYKSI